MHEPCAVKYRFLDTDKQSDRMDRERDKDKFQINKDSDKNSFILRIIKELFFYIFYLYIWMKIEQKFYII